MYYVLLLSSPTFPLLVTVGLRHVTTLRLSICYRAPYSVMASVSNVLKSRHLSILTKIRIYQALVTSVLLYTAETWTVLASDLKTLEAFHMKCQRQIRQVNWQQFIRNEEITATTGLPSISDIIPRRRNAVFGHIARLDTTIPAHQALRAYVSLSLGRNP